MLRVFLKGFVFGIGFIVAILVLGGITPYFLDIFEGSSSIETFESLENQKSWNDLSFDEKAQKASAIIVLRYKEADDGLMLAYVAEVHKKDSSIESLFNIGDGYSDADYYLKSDDWQRRNGVVMLLTGSPAENKNHGLYYMYDDRLGPKDMPLEVFLKKFNQESRPE